MGLNVGLLSTAKINTAIIEGAARTDSCAVVAVASRDGARAEAYAAEHAIARAHASYEALLADPDVDVVYNPLPNSMHVDWSVRALRAGKHVLCEKPMSRHPAEIERAFDAAEQAGLLLAEAFMWRHHPQVDRLRELLPRIGELRLIRGAFSFPLSSGGNIRLSRELEGGALMDVGCYCVSAARLLAGEPEACAGAQVLGGDGVDVRFVGTMRFGGDVLAHFDCGMDLPFRDELEVVGSEGSLFLDDPWHSRGPVIEVRAADGSVERAEVPVANPYTRQLDAFAAAVRGDGPHPFGRADALGQARAIAALYEAAAR
jgi:D-xylose 1-dehydrogenase (NADP+, D-xylono-1,5-lactone-forming)